MGRCRRPCGRRRRRRSWAFPLELPLRHEQRGAGVGAREGPLLPVADHPVPCEHLRDALGEGAREQLHVQLAQGYGPVVVQSGRARYLGAEPDVRVPPVHRWRGAAEDGPGRSGTRSHWTGAGRALMKRASTWLGPGALPSALSRAGLQVLHGVLLDLCPGSLRDPGDVAAEDRLETREGPPGVCHTVLARRRELRTSTSWASVRSVWVLGTRTFQRPDGPGASTSMAPRTAFHRWGDVGGVAAPEFLDGALAVCRQEGAEAGECPPRGRLLASPAPPAAGPAWSGGTRATHSAVPP